MAKVTHGMKLAEGGERSLIHFDPKLVKRLDELRVLMDTEPGRRDLRVELGARVALIVELGIAEIGRQMEQQGSDLFDTSVIHKLGTYVNTLSRMLRDWPSPIDDAIQVTELERIDKALKDHGGD